jgi:predicted metal-dependent phosphoesterase TrpH
MGQLVDMHMHTRRHSRCSAIDEYRLVEQAVSRGLGAIVITEHHYQWGAEELTEIFHEAAYPNFVVLAGFEYTSNRGDILIYGLQPHHVPLFVPGGPPEDAVKRAHDLGGFCIGAHPTRAGMDFDERIYTLGLDALEVRSVNMRDHEQERAIRLAQRAELPPVTFSDAHKLENVGHYAVELDVPVQSMAELHEAFRHGTFRPAAHSYHGSAT